MKKYLTDLTISDIRYLNSKNILIKLVSEDTLPEMLPGQFAELKVENEPQVFLRRPFSIHYVDKTNNEMWFLIQIIGNGTRRLSQLKRGDKINIIYPLGNSFSIPKEKPLNTLLIGGGVGVAPMLFLAAELKKNNHNIDILLGCRCKDDLVQLNEFARFGNVFTTTEDGSCGEKGFVVHHSILEKNTYDRIYTCGPTPMMKAVATYATQKNIYCEVSLENTMACGIGACLCCVTPTKEGHKCVCTDGPVFEISKLEHFI